MHTDPIAENVTFIKLCLSLARQSAACFFGCAKSAAKQQRKSIDASTETATEAGPSAGASTANLLSTWTIASRDLGLVHSLALM